MREVLDSRVSRALRLCASDRGFVPGLPNQLRKSLFDDLSLEEHVYSSNGGSYQWISILQFNRVGGSDWGRPVATPFPVRPENEFEISVHRDGAKFSFEDPLKDKNLVQIGRLWQDMLLPRLNAADRNQTSRRGSIRKTLKV